MTQLTRVELRRILSRKILHLSLLAIVAVALMTFWGLGQTIQPASSYEAQARADLEQVHAQWEQEQEFAQDQNEDFVAQCLADQEAERERSGDANIDFGCVWEEPTLESIIAGYAPPPMFELLTSNLQQTGTIVFILALLGGSTATAAEFAHRTMGTWLTFEPRRDRVFASKVLASGLAAIPITVVFLALFLAGIPLLYQLRGVEASVTATQWADVGWMSARMVVLAILLGLVGAAAGMLLKHTGAVLGIVVGYLMVVENMVRGLFPDWSKYLLSDNALAWLNNGHRTSTWVCEDAFSDECREVVKTISLEHGAVVIGVAGLVLILISWLVFRRRDVN